jgi:hypothetical protein
MTHPELNLFRPGVTPDDVSRLRHWLTSVPRDWQTRRQLTVFLGWSERKLRDVAESMGSEIVRGQRGFKLTADLERDDLSSAAQAADAALSQGKRMIRYGLALKRKLHSKLI